MFDFFKKRIFTSDKVFSTDFSFVEVDMHSHILPGIDDGAKNMEEAILLIKRMQTMGYSKLIATPHISSDFFPNTPDVVLECLYALKEQLAATGDIHIEVEAAAEYMIDETFLSLLEKGGPFLSIGGKYLLFEMGFVQEDPRFYQAIFGIQAAGLKPVLAHPERYSYYHHEHKDFWKELKDRGCLLQLNTMALCGYYGKQVKSCAEQLLHHGFYDFLGSDIHHSRHCSALESISRTQSYEVLKKSSILNNSLK